MTREDGLQLYLKRWPIFALILLAWIVLGYIIPFIASVILKMPDNFILFNRYVKLTVPLLIFVIFLYFWYKLTELFYKGLAKKKASKEEKT